jgi:hypothetical protein
MKNIITKINRYSDIVPLKTIELDLTKRQIEYILNCINQDKEKFRSVGMCYVLENLLIEHYNLSILEDTMNKLWV